MQHQPAHLAASTVSGRRQRKELEKPASASMEVAAQRRPEYHGYAPVLAIFGVHRSYRRRISAGEATVYRTLPVTVGHDNDDDAVSWLSDPLVIASSSPVPRTAKLSHSKHGHFRQNRMFTAVAAHP